MVKPLIAFIACCILVLSGLNVYASPIKTGKPYLKGYPKWLQLRTEINREIKKLSRCPGYRPALNRLRGELRISSRILGNINRHLTASQRVSRRQHSIYRNQIKLHQTRLQAITNALSRGKCRKQNEYQHTDQVVNQEMQALSRLMRALGTMRTQVGLAGQKY